VIDALWSVPGNPARHLYSRSADVAQHAAVLMRSASAARPRSSEVAVPDRYYLIALTSVPGIGPIRTRRLLSAFGSAEAAWRAPLAALCAAGLDERLAAALVALRRTLDPEMLPARLERARTRALVPADAEYPARLAELPYAPPVLFVRGGLTAADARAVAVVGTRRATNYGREVTRRLTADLVAAGVTIVSGLARGIDAVAHQTALAARGRTLAVLGCGTDVVYPPEHRHLAEQIVEQGALISEYPPGTAPDGPNFPARNRFIAALALGVLVVEAPARSGALLTANFAADQGRQVFAVPGSILGGSAEGCHALIREGATLVTSAAELLADLNLAQQELRAEARRLPLGDDETENALLRLLSAEPAHADELSRASGLPISTVNATLTIMELKGLVRQAAPMSYTLA
jgi:DNA processing protein